MTRARASGRQAERGKVTLCWRRQVLLGGFPGEPVTAQLCATTVSLVGVDDPCERLGKLKHGPWLENVGLAKPGDLAEERMAGVFREFIRSMLRRCPLARTGLIAESDNKLAPMTNDP